MSCEYCEHECIAYKHHPREKGAVMENGGAE